MSGPQSCGARVVLLGASNLAAGVRELAAIARACFDGELELLVAAGNGRSYGQRSHFLARVLPGIDQCGLWAALERAPTAPTYALATDLGNDLAFGASAREVQAWVELSLERLARQGASTVVTGLPLAALERMPAWEFRLWARVLFPWHAIERERLLDQARELDGRLAELARERGLVKVDPQLAWYGRDPIHVRRSLRAQAWRCYAAPWGAPGAPPARLRMRGRAWYQEVRLFGVECGAAQPCARFERGSLSLF